VASLCIKARGRVVGGWGSCVVARAMRLNKRRGGERFAENQGQVTAGGLPALLAHPRNRCRNAAQLLVGSRRKGGPPEIHPAA
jgi:hypothetical protein